MRGTHADLGGGAEKKCHAVLISKTRAVTAAHCFTGYGHAQMSSMVLFGEEITADRVRFHSNTWSDGATAWTSLRHLSDINHAFDIAILEVPFEPDVAPVKLWSPFDAEQLDLSGRTLSVGGHDLEGRPASGELTITRLDPRDGGYHLRARPAPSGVTSGDSGGGATIVLTADLPGSRHLNLTSNCRAPVAQVGEPVLVGINEATADETGDEFFVATYTEAIATWLASGAFDVDGDDVCDDVDVCLRVRDPAQRNCNAFAERDPRWGGTGLPLGDACDATPCSHGDAYSSDYQAGPSQFESLNTSYGREIFDMIGLEPVIEPGASASTMPTIRFCMCRNADGSPVGDPAVCEGAPHWCTRDPAQFTSTPTEVAHGRAPGPRETYWRTITLDPAGERRGQTQVSHPSAIQFVRWDYQADYADWKARGLLQDLPYDARFGPGTDMAGMLWIRASTLVGNDEHGLPSEIAACTLGDALTCSISDHFANAVAPDLRTTSTRQIRLPRYRPNPIWSSCAQCGAQEQFMRGDIVSNPARFVTIDDQLRTHRWTDRGGLDVTDMFTADLRSAITQPGSIVVGASEPSAVLDSRAPRALMVSTDGTSVLGAVTEASGRFGFQSSRSIAPRSTPRSGFAAAYQRAAGALHVVGGTSRGVAQPDVLTYQSGGWTRVALRDAAQAPVAVRASVFAATDARVWALDDAGWGAIVVRRIDPVSGAVQSHAGISALSGLTEVWATALADGRVLVAGNTATGHRLVVLGLSQPTRTAAPTVVVVGSASRAGTLAMGPEATRTEVAVALVDGGAGSVAVRPDVVALAALGVR